jgi:hypothetical protein
MYEGWCINHPSTEWIRKTEDFIDRAFALSRTGVDVRCPCSMCRVCRCQDKRTLSGHLCKYGYMPAYVVYHCEEFPRGNVSEAHNNDDVEYDIMDEMLEDLRDDPDFVFPQHPKEPPPPDVKMFFDLLKAAEEPLHEHTKVSILAFVTQLMAIKSKFVFSNNCYNELLNLINEVFPPNHKMSKDMYQCRKLLFGLGTSYQKIDVCPDNCMLFWKDHENGKKCLKCGKPRYVEVKNDDGEMDTSTIAQKQLHYMPLAPRVKRLFLLRNTTRHMRWHKEREREDTHVMTHPSNSDAWKALDDFDPEFAS